MTSPSRDYATYRGPDIGLSGMSLGRVNENGVRYVGQGPDLRKDASK
jgi:hypothetical protein